MQARLQQTTSQQTAEDFMKGCWVYSHGLCGSGHTNIYNSEVIEQNVFDRKGAKTSNILRLIQ